MSRMMSSSRSVSIALVATITPVTSRLRTRSASV
jgi:hypothetical protein